MFCSLTIILTIRMIINASTINEKFNNNSLVIGKCCELNELLLDDTCTPVKETNETPWEPKFFVEKENQGTIQPNVKFINYRVIFGLPKCLPNERQWKVYHHKSGEDCLAIMLPSGHLRHYTADLGIEEDWLRCIDDDDVQEKYIHLDYAVGHYCIDKVILTRDHLVASYALVCVPELAIKWKDTRYLMRHVIDPIFHAVSIASYLIVAIVYFVLPQLRDLVGNMITTMTLCLIISQCASIVTTFTDFSNHLNFLMTGTYSIVHWKKYKNMHKLAFFYRIHQIYFAFGSIFLAQCFRILHLEYI